MLHVTIVGYYVRIVCNPYKQKKRQRFYTDAALTSIGSLPNCSLKHFEK